MRKHTKTGEKRYKVLSRKGHYTVPRLIAKTIESRRKPVNLAGKVLKPHFPLMTPQAAAQTRKKVNEFIRELREAGVYVLPTRIVSTPTKVKGKVQLNFVQDYVGKRFVLDKYLSVNLRQLAVIFDIFFVFVFLLI